MPRRLVRLAVETAARLADQGVARENARVQASALAQARVDRLEVEHYLEQQGVRRPTWSGPPRVEGSLPRELRM